MVDPRRPGSGPIRRLFVRTQALALVVTGLMTFAYSHDLMTLLIHRIGEERALGEDNVIRLENGVKLLTNPGAMVGWTVPFWAFGCLQIGAAITLVWPGTRGDRAIAPDPTRI